MLNEQSRKYFTRAFLMSGSAFHSYPLSWIRKNNLEGMQNSTKIYDIERLAKHLATTDIANLLEYNVDSGITWAPTIESINAPHAFLVESPKEVYASNPPYMDTMFSFDAYEGLGPFKDYLNKTEALIKADLSSPELPFFIDGFTKNNFPKVRIQFFMHAIFIRILWQNSRWFFQEYDQAMSLLRNAYYSNEISAEAMPYQNFALLSDLGLVWGILKAVMYQANTNNNFFNTFLFR